MFRQMRQINYRMNRFAKVVVLHLQFERIADISGKDWQQQNLQKSLAITRWLMRLDDAPSPNADIPTFLWFGWLNVRLKWMERYFDLRDQIRSFRETTLSPWGFPHPSYGINLYLSGPN